MRIAFAGTPEFAASALRALVEAGHDVALVLTQPDRPAGRGMRIGFSPVKQLATAQGIPVYQPATLKLAEAELPLAAADVEVMVVAAYGLILPPSVLTLPKGGCLNIHASLLPRWRGAAPIQRAILAGDGQTGVCIMQMEAGLDTGPVLLSRPVPISSVETGGTLHDKLAHLGSVLIVEALAMLVEGKLRPTQQPAEGATYADKVGKEEAEVDWTQPASVIERKIRAFNPSPVAQTRLRGKALRLWQARVEGGKGEPGRVIDTDATGIIVGCGKGALAVTELQKAGGRRLKAVDFLTGNPIAPGDVFG